MPLQASPEHVGAAQRTSKTLLYMQFASAGPVPAQVSGWRKQLDDKEKPETYVVSRYLESPLLIGSRKFDLRIYALVLSYVPLKVYLHRSGQGLICTSPSACVCATGVAE